ncbi:peptidase [Bifidobacterium catenulatum subsp. kashiwanohense]|uniref:peptidase n=1 Tax=Bifidobacterium catenulatum TaxID=1686 RepID=UPI003D03990D
MSGVHESLTDWRTLPMNILAGHRAIVQLDEGTIIDGYLEHVPSKLRKELRGATEGIRESLTVEGVYQPVIVSVNAGEKHLANGVKAVNILKEMSA